MILENSGLGKYIITTIIGYMIVVLPGLALHIYAIVNAYNGESKAESEGDHRPLSGSSLFDDAMRRQR